MTRIAGLALLFASSTFAADWNPRLAADYLDGRQKEWFAWATAKSPGGPCVSCHTGVTYLMARPALRKVLGEAQPTVYETGLLDGMRARVDKRESKDIAPLFPKEPAASQAVGVEAIHAAVLLGSREAIDRMWSLQSEDGGWNWFSLKLDPWEMPPSRFYGAALAARVSGNPKQTAGLKSYLAREQAAQPLHNRMMLLWLADAKEAKAIREELLKKQQQDGTWTMESLGPWEKPATAANQGYATSFAALALLKSGVKQGDPRLRRALDWLAAHQDRATGAWPGESMNKKYPPESMMVKFMSDAATAYASLALIEGGRR